MKSKEIYALFKCDLGQRNLTDEERLSLFIAAQAGDQVAKNRLVRDNTWLVIKIAWRYAEPGNPFYNLNDLIQEGCIGLISSIEKFDPEKGKFSDYAGHWIRQKINTYLSRNRFAAPLPRQVYDLVLAYRKLSTLHQAKYGHYPASPEDVGFTDQESKIIKLAEKVSLASDLEGVGTADDYSYIYLGQLKNQLPELCEDLLTPKEFEVIRLRWLNGTPPTQKAVAEHLGISKQAVRDREIRALAKLESVLQEFR